MKPLTINVKKKRFKPVYKKILKLRENIKNNKKLLCFKRAKWASLVSYLKRNVKKYRKYKIKDQHQHLVTKYPNRNLSYTKRYKNNLIVFQKFSGIYDLILKKTLKFILTKNRTEKENVINFVLRQIESRLDVVIVRAKFCSSLRQSRQLIKHSKIYVNNKIITTKSFKLKPGDLINVNIKNSHCIKNNIKSMLQYKLWPLTPKHLMINYKTLQILVGNYTSSFTFLDLNLQMSHIVSNYKYH